MTAHPEDKYIIFQKEIIKQLEKRQWFIDCIASNYNSIALSWNCSVLMSVRRLGEAYDFWREDHTRTLSEGIQTSVSLDHFKHASFIAFWLRRMLPINQTLIHSKYQSIPDDRNATDNQKFFFRYGNELCALLIGFMICLFYEASYIAANQEVLQLVPNRLDCIRQYRLPPEIISDFVMIMKHKNMSPHALYLLYKSLFTVISPKIS